MIIIRTRIHMMKMNMRRLLEERFYSLWQDSPSTDALKTSTKNSKADNHAPVTSQNASSDKYDEDFDDFDPRGTSSAKPSSGSQQVDLVGQDFGGDLLDIPVSVPTEKPTSLDSDP